MYDYAKARLAMVNSQIRPSDVTDHRIQDAMGAAQSIQVGYDGTLYGATDPRRPGGAALGD